MQFQFGELRLDEERFTLIGANGPIHVEPQVFELLRHLVVHHDRVVSKHELLDAIWGHRFVTESTLTSRVKAARRAVGDDGKAQRVIKTVHGRGYRFVAELRSEAGPVAQALPRLRSALIGRDADIDSIIELIGRAALVTVTGSGGIGKTTVALAVAGRMHAEFADGVVFVDLSPVPPQADVARAVADAVGVEGAGASESVDGLSEHLAGRPLLLVLDNCEHVLDRTAELVDRMLVFGDAVRVLATSREALGVAGEHVWPLGPLHGEGPTLFVERARAAEPRVQWDPSDPAVIDLCRRLDDVPLALELAAGQLRRFELSELIRRLDDRLALQWGSSGGGAQRHASMETAIDWSNRFLEPSEQCLLRHLSVFPSSFDVRAVEASAPLLSNSTPIEALGQLVEKSLVVRLPGSGRYRLLETIRAFARARLEEAGEATAALERHRRHVRDRIGATSRLDRWMSARLAAELRTDLEDSRQAFRLSVQQEEGEDAVEIAVGSSFLWRNAVGCAEGDAWVQALQGLELTNRDQLWLNLLRADVGQGRGDPRQMFSASPATVDDPDEDPAGVCLAAHYEALAYLTNEDQAKRRLVAALDLAHRSQDPRLVTLMEAFLAVADVAAGDLDDAREALLRIAPRASPDGYDRFIVHWAGWMLGLAEQDAVSARSWMRRQQEYLDHTGIVETWITSFSTAMCDVIDGGDLVAGLERALALADREGYHADADCVLILAYAELCAGQLESAAELTGTALHDRFNATAHYVLYRAVLDRPLHHALDEGSMNDALTRGRKRSSTEALADHGITRGPALGP